MRKQLLLGGLSAATIAGSMVVPTSDLFAPTRRRDIDHVGNYNIVVELDGVSVGRFESATGLAAEMKVVETSPSDATGSVLHKRPGAAAAGNVSLRGGFLAGEEMAAWWDATRDPGADPRKNMDVVVYDLQDNELRRYSLKGCWPTKWRFQDLDGKGSDVAAEEIEFVVEELYVK